MSKLNNIYNAWITLNRVCNLRCNWCYAKHTHYDKADDIPLNQAFHIINMLSELNIPHISLIGGEPTLYPELLQVIKYAKEHNITCGIITNGIKLADESFLVDLKEFGLQNVSLSLKGYSKENFNYLTGIDGYNIALNAIRNLAKNDVPFSVSMVIDRYNSKNFLSGIYDAVKQGATNFYLSFEFDFSVLNNNYSNFCFNDIFKMVEDFCDKYTELCKITNDNFVFHQTLPICIWEEDIIKEMQTKSQIHSSCQLLQKSGIVFDTKGNIIPCNALYQYTLGKYNEDFFDSCSLKKHLSSTDVCEFYKKISTLPSKMCVDCKNWSVCGGGCISNWINFDFETLIKKYHEYKSKLI